MSHLAAVAHRAREHVVRYVVAEEDIEEDEADMRQDLEPEAPACSTSTAVVKGDPVG